MKEQLAAYPGNSLTPATPAKPVLIWSAIGLTAMIVIVVTVAQWIFSPGFTPAPTGSDPMPDWMPIWITVLECFFTGAAIPFFWFYLIQPWRQQGHITWDGMFLLACITIWYQDPIDNYFNFTFTYNAHFHNMSSWADHIPGWQSPRGGNFAEPYLFMGSFFLWVFFGASVFGCWMLDTFRKRLPALSSLSHIALIFIVFAIIDLLIESLFCVTGVYAYVAVYSPLSLWAGTPHQFPLYESTGVGAMLTAVTVLRYYRDDHGYSFVEKGMQHLRISAPLKRWLSFFSMVAAIQAIAFVLFYGQYQWFALKADSFAKYPSYRLLEICGQGTPYACPTQEAPMAKKRSIAIPPDDPRLSPSARLN